MIELFNNTKLLKIILCLKKWVGPIAIGCTCIGQALAKEFTNKGMGIDHTSSQAVYYIALKPSLGNLSLDEKQPQLRQYASNSSFPSPSFAGMLALLGGCQINPYIAMELGIEWLISTQKYQIHDAYSFGISSTPKEKTSTLYTVGLGLDCIPMVPVSETVSLSALLGIGYKTAGVEVLDVKEFTTMGWKFIPRIGLGGTINDEILHLSCKFVVEFNNCFRDMKHPIFNPSMLFCTQIGINFNEF